MNKVVLVVDKYGFTTEIDVPDTSDFRAGDSVYYEYNHAKVVEVRHDLNEKVTYFVCE